MDIKQLTTKLCIAVSALAGFILTSCGGNSEADKAAAAYYEEKFNDEENTYGQTMKGAVTKWESMEESRKMSVKGRIMKTTIGFYHEKEQSPIGQYFVMQKDGNGWKVRSMSRGSFLTKERREDIEKNIKKDQSEAQFGPQEQAALDAWMEVFTGHKDIFGHDITDPDAVAKSAESYMEKYGEYIDCFIGSGSGKWSNENGGSIRLEVYHEKGSNQFSTIVRRQEDGSWAAAY